MEKLRKAMRSPSTATNSHDSVENIKVCVRLKAQSELDPDGRPNPPSPWSFDSNSWPNQIQLEPQFSEANRKQQFSHSYDAILTGSDNFQIYDCAAKSIVGSAMDGFHGTIFAYGQTSSGKTYTMTGTEDEPGIIPQAVDDVFKHIRRAGNTKEFLLRISYIEIYNETIKDLLATEQAELRIHEDKYRGVYVAPLKEEIVTNPKQVMRIIERGEANRHVSANNYHEHSSRSHTIFQMVIESNDSQLGSNSFSMRLGLGTHHRTASQSGVKLSYLSLIDLAGSEKFTSNNDRRKEASFINKSLLTLGAVISKIADGKTGHIPFRDSKLTRILQTTLTGNCRVGVICTVNQDLPYIDESINTLKFGARVKKINTRAQVNKVADEKALIQKYHSEINELKTKLNKATVEQSKESSKTSVAANVDSAQEQELEALRLQNQKYEEEVMELHLARTTYKERIDHLTKLILSSSSMGDKVFKRSRPMSVHIGHRSSNSLNPRLSLLGKQRDKNERLEWALGDIKFKNRYIKELEGLLQSLAPETAASPAKVFRRYTEIQGLKENWDVGSISLNAEKEKAMEEKVSNTLGRVASLRLSRQFAPVPFLRAEPLREDPPEPSSLEEDDIIEEQNKIILELEQERKYQTQTVADLKDRVRQLEMQQFRRAELAATKPVSSETTALKIRVAELEVALEAEREWRKKFLQANAAPRSPTITSAPISPIPPPRLRPTPSALQTDSGSSSPS
ncbi:Kinesin-like protein kip2 [Entomophthora muscae]|uniref:Kinesin-like protein kip2 n=1 Tax=Entomophthora muscae TaxID=34485 RepID=A0ACC2UJL0_9FUNG|nr:Kinesin-like protein kip2 [Entomophthora muscae]